MKSVLGTISPIPCWSTTVRSVVSACRPHGSAGCCRARPSGSRLCARLPGVCACPAAHRPGLHSNRTLGPNAQSDETGHNSSSERWARRRRERTGSRPERMLLRTERRFSRTERRSSQQAGMRPWRSAGDSAVHTMLPRQFPLILCCLWRSDSSAVTELMQYPAGRLSRFALILTEPPVGGPGR